MSKPREPTAWTETTSSALLPVPGYIHESHTHTQQHAFPLAQAAAEQAGQASRRSGSISLLGIDSISPTLEVLFSTVGEMPRGQPATEFVAFASVNSAREKKCKIKKEAV
ncbi:hypothetical protein ElyMa_002613800 [Elysia marginata]|uniref:RRM domain-containing protein n=1 Tax=Elysia marginata TaxID=1093978 RepID=A0AAV4H4R7_9GAST|nr:hypothetical protein ElyMa_002613800 [Elysia marginata]